MAITTRYVTINARTPDGSPAVYEPFRFILPASYDGDTFISGQDITVHTNEDGFLRVRLVATTNLIGTVGWTVVYPSGQQSNTFAVPADGDGELRLNDLILGGQPIADPNSLYGVLDNRYATPAWVTEYLNGLSLGGGAGGNGFLIFLSPPTSADGVEGQFGIYRYLVGGVPYATLYGPKTSGVWPATPLNGAAGANGTNGTPGTTGPAGTTDYTQLTNKPDLTGFATLTLLQGFPYTVWFDGGLWANFPSAATDWIGRAGNTSKHDLSAFTHFRLGVNRSPSQPNSANSKVWAEYNTTFTTGAGTTLATTASQGELRLSSSYDTNQVTAWLALPNAAKADVWIKLRGSNGTDNIDTTFGLAYLQFKRQVGG